MGLRICARAPPATAAAPTARYLWQGVSPGLLAANRVWCRNPAEIAGAHSCGRPLGPSFAMADVRAPPARARRNLGALDRLSLDEEGRLLYRMKRARGESLYVMLTPDELLARLATLVPPPRSHSLRYHGFFAPNAKHRGRVVAGGAGRAPKCATGEGSSDRSPERAAGPTAPAFRLAAPPPSTRGIAPSAPVAVPRYRVPRAELLQKVFALDVLECPRCAGRLEVIAYIAEPKVARRILDHLGLASQAPPCARARGPADDAGFEPGPDYSVADPLYED